MAHGESRMSVNLRASALSEAAVAAPSFSPRRNLSRCFSSGAVGLEYAHWSFLSPVRGDIWRGRAAAGHADGLMSPLAGLKNLSWTLLLPRLTPWATLCRPSGPKMLAGLRNLETPDPLPQGGEGGEREDFVDN